MIDREDLLDKLELVTPALSPESTNNVMCHYWFTGTHLMAFNDQIAYSVPLPTDFTGAVRKELVGILSACNSPEVKLRNDNTALTVLIGRDGRYAIPMLDASSFAGLFEMPRTRMVQMATGEDREKLLTALRMCLLSVSTDLSRPEYLGITVMVRDGSVLMFATNGRTMTHAKLGANGWPALNRVVVLPTLFCEQAIKLITRSESVSIGVHDNHVLMKGDDVLLYGHLIDGARAIDYPNILNVNFPQSVRNKAGAIPKLFHNVIERAVQIADTGDTPKSKIAVKDGKLVIDTVGDIAFSGHDVVQWFPQAEASINVTPKLIRDGLKDFSNILVTNNVVVLCTADTTSLIYFVASLDGAR